MVEKLLGMPGADAASAEDAGEAVEAALADFVVAAALARAVGECLLAGDSIVGVGEVPASVSAEGWRPQANMLAPGIFQPLLQPGAARLRPIRRGAKDFFQPTKPILMARSFDSITSKTFGVVFGCCAQSGWCAGLVC